MKITVKYRDTEICVDEQKSETQIQYNTADLKKIIGEMVENTIKAESPKRYITKTENDE